MGLPPGSRSPSVGAPMSDTGNMPGMSNPLKVSIALGQKPAIIQKGPFYLMKPEPIVMSEVTGATNLMASKNLEHAFQKLASKKMKDSLSSFLPGLPGIVDTPGSQDNSSLRSLIEKPPVGGKELVSLNQVQAKEKKKHKKKKHRGSETPAHEDGRTDEEREKRREKKHKKHDRESEERKKKKKDKKKKRSKEDKDM